MPFKRGDIVEFVRTNEEWYSVWDKWIGSLAIVVEDADKGGLRVNSIAGPWRGNSLVDAKYFRKVTEMSSDSSL